MSLRVIFAVSCVAAVVPLAGCGDHDVTTADVASVGALTAVPAPPSASTYVLPGPPRGSLAIEGTGLPGAPSHLEIAAAYAYFVEWPTPSDIVPALRLSHVDLIFDPADDHGCEAEGAARPKANCAARLERVELRGKGVQSLSWDTDIAIGDDLELCFFGGGHEGADGKSSGHEVSGHDGDCNELTLNRWEAILSLSRRRVRGRLHHEDSRGSIEAQFRADVCRPPPPP